MYAVIILACIQLSAIHVYLNPGGGKMQLKKQGSSYSVLRTTYDASENVKRGVQRSLGTIAVGSILIPEKIATQLTPDELADVQQKLNTFAEESKQASSQLSVDVLSYAVHNVAKNINNGVRFSDEQDAEKLFKSLAELKIALRKAGYKRPRPAAAPAAVVAESKPAGKQEPQQQGTKGRTAAGNSPKASK